MTILQISINQILTTPTNFIENLSALIICFLRIKFLSFRTVEDACPYNERLNFLMRSRLYQLFLLRLFILFLNTQNYDCAENQADAYYGEDRGIFLEDEYSKKSSADGLERGEYRRLGGLHSLKSHRIENVRQKARDKSYSDYPEPNCEVLTCDTCGEQAPICDECAA